MALPKAIQAQIEQADAIVEQLQQGVTPPEDTSAHEQGDDAAPAVPQPVTIEPVVQPVPVQADDAWERKFHSLQGKYDAEVPRMAQQIREMGQSIQTLINENAELKAKAAQPVQAPEPVAQLVTDSDREAFGQDLIDLADRIAKQNLAAMQGQNAKLEAELNELRSQVGNVGKQVSVSAEERFFTGLSSSVADWQDINADQGFLSWLDEIDPIYGLPRQAALDNAFGAKDVNRVAAIFNAYKTVSGRNKQVKPQQSLESQVAPTRSRNTPAPVNNNGSNARIWSQADISAFYTEKRRGYMDDAQAARIEAEIEQAVAEGRVSL